MKSKGAHNINMDMCSPILVKEEGKDPKLVIDSSWYKWYYFL